MSHSTGMDLKMERGISWLLHLEILPEKSFCAAFADDCS